MEHHDNPQELEEQRTAVRQSYGEDQLDHIYRAKEAVVEVWNEYVSGKTMDEITIDDLYVVWFCFTLGNWKCLISSDHWTDTSYFEVSYSAVKKERFVDHYRKVSNTAIPDSSDFNLATLWKRLS
jgi:hypothetical protein